LVDIRKANLVEDNRRWRIEYWSVSPFLFLTSPSPFPRPGIMPPVCRRISTAHEHHLHHVTLRTINVRPLAHQRVDNGMGVSRRRREKNKKKKKTNVNIGGINQTPGSVAHIKNTLNPFSFGIMTLF
jgi:hypothetical protein